MTPLLREIKDLASIFKEDDMMPMLSSCSTSGDMRPAQALVNFLESKNIKLSAKIYSVLVKGFI